MCHLLMESEQEFLYQFFVRNVSTPSELNRNPRTTTQILSSLPHFSLPQHFLSL